MLERLQVSWWTFGEKFNLVLSFEGKRGGFVTVAPSEA